MTELPAEHAPRVQPSGFEWPVDILHISDLHFWGYERFDQRRNSDWQAFLSHIDDSLKKNQFRPSVIAFTGDLVETAGPRQGFRRGVNALLELAHHCGFLPHAVTWDAQAALPPQAWWDLLYHRIFIVPGNHDIYLMGLRKLWQRWTKNWRKIATPQLPKPSKTPHSLIPVPVTLVDPLAIMLIDSNGKRAFWQYARGEVERQVALEWPQDRRPTDNHFCVALVHGHPVQLPFFLHGVTNAEAAMTMENAGLLMKNLANLGIRLILHGHRHYPGICTLRLPDVNGVPRSIVVVGAGSVTKAPLYNGFCGSCSTPPPV